MSKPMSKQEAELAASRLMLAAPALLAACKAVLAERYHEEKEAYDLVEAAIALAEGKDGAGCS